MSGGTVAGATASVPTTTASVSPDRQAPATTAEPSAAPAEARTSTASNQPSSADAAQGPDLGSSPIDDGAARQHSSLAEPASDAAARAPAPTTEHRPSSPAHSSTAAASDRSSDLSEKPRAQAATVSSDSDGAASDALPAPAPAPAKGGPPPADDKPQRPKSKVALLMLALCMAVFLAALDMTIITTALPTIATEFQASQADYTWVGSCYLLAAAAGGPSWGKVSDIFGRKPVILAANVVFFVGSLICAVSINVQMLEAGRVLQGIGGGGLLILVNVCISDLFSMRDRGKFFGFVGMTWAIASAVGPIIGGVFTQLVTWRWCFYINLPLTGAAFLILSLFLDIETPRTPLVAGLKALDWLGSLTMVGGTVMFLIGLESGGIAFPWASPVVICLIVFGCVVLALFVAVEARVARYPLVPLRLLRGRSTVACYGVCFLHGAVFIAGSYFLPLYFQAVLGASPLLSGVYLLPFVLALSGVSGLVGVFIKRTGRYREPIWAGLALMTLGYGLFVDFPPRLDLARLIGFQVVAGLGTGPNFQAPLIALQSRVAPHDIAAATAAFGTVRNLASAVSVVVGGVIFQNEMAARGPGLAAPGPARVAPDVLAQLAAGDAGQSTALVAALPDAPRAAVHAAYTGSLRTLWIFYTCLGAVALGISLLIGGRELSRDHTVTKTGLAAQEEGRRHEAEARARRRQDRAASRGDLEKATESRT